jgi:hypothetical protein
MPAREAVVGQECGAAPALEVMWQRLKPFSESTFSS